MKGSAALRAAARLRTAARHGVGGGPRATSAQRPEHRFGEAAAWPSHRRRTSCAFGANKNSASPGRRRWLELHRASSSISGTAMASNGEVLKDIHNSESTKTLLKSDALYEYMLKTTVYPRENEFLRELRLITKQHTYGFMSSPPDEGQLLTLLLKVMGARNTIEVGVFTGCSVLATALAIPNDGRVVAIDVSREYFDLGLPVIKKAGVAHKVDFREGSAGPILDGLIADEADEGGFDFAFVDADKSNYHKYHEQLLRLVRVDEHAKSSKTAGACELELNKEFPQNYAEELLLVVACMGKERPSSGAAARHLYAHGEELRPVPGSVQTSRRRSYCWWPARARKVHCLAMQQAVWTPTTMHKDAK